VIAEITDGGVDRSVECTGSVGAMISAFECVHDVMFLKLLLKSFDFSMILTAVYQWMSSNAKS